MAKWKFKIDPKIRMSAYAIAAVALIFTLIAFAIAAFTDDAPAPTNLQGNWF